MAKKPARSFQMSRGSVKLGSKVKNETGPGAFITEGTMKDMMLEQKRAFIGGSRTYGREYDNYYQDRRWQTESGSREPSFLPEKTRRKLQKVAKAIVDKAIKKGAKEAPMAGLGTLTVSEAAKLSGLGLIDASVTHEDQGDGPVAQYLSMEDLTYIRGGTTPEDLSGDLPGLGGDGLGADNFNPVTAIQDIWSYTKDIKETVEPMSPLFSFVGDHPIMTVSALILALGLCGAAGAFVGGGGVDLLDKYLATKKGG